MATFGYARGSNDRADVENQRQELELAGYNVDYWFADKGVNGSIRATDRLQFKELLMQIGDGEQLVVTKLDRLGRDAQDISATIETLAKRRIEIIVLQLGKLDLTSSAGKLMVTMLAAMAEMERALLIERSSAPRLAWLV